MDLKIECGAAAVAPIPGRTGPPLGPAGTDGGAGAGEVPEMKGNHTKKALPKAVSLGWIAPERGVPLERAAKGRDWSQQLKPLGTVTACFGKFWIKPFVSLLFCG